MDYGYKYSAVVTEAFAASVNQLPVLREAIATAYPNILPDNRQASVVSVFMVSDAAFTVSFNLGVTGLVARLNAAGDYELTFSGSIAHLAFAAETTLKTFEIEWYPDAINYKTVTFATVPETAVTIVVKDQYDNTYIASEDGTYELLPGHYVCSADHEDYDAIVVPFFVMADSETVDVVFDMPTEYTITFEVTPADSTVVVRTAGNTVVAPVSPNVYSLEDSTVAGIYTFAVSKTGYVTATGNLDVQADATETVALDIATYERIFTVTPVDATFALTDSEATPITPDSSLPAGTYTFDALEDSRVSGDYTYTASKADYLTETGDLTITAAGTLALALELELDSIEITTPPTKTEYIAGELFSAVGAVVTATFADASTAVVTDDATWTPTAELVVEDVAAVASYTYAGITKTDSVAITVTDE